MKCRSRFVIRLRLSRWHGGLALSSQLLSRDSASVCRDDSF
ncbi:Uncharacterized protein dnm_075220 [Desulfonema magnum]|uniref:Uncharacterized protein n=1 Tax=Desulfonema magnum TaxID=45655 RepID=A0A975GRZ0_9BACT|nr:Uncharacterized protein dnm_075220 [Desulfonema magnum]